MGNGPKIRMVVGTAIVTWSPWSEDAPLSATARQECRLPFANDDASVNAHSAPLKLRVVSRRG